MSSRQPTPPGSFGQRVVDSGSLSRLQTPPGWTNQRVTENATTNFNNPPLARTNTPADATLSNTDSQWQNQIARHLLSVYATTKSVENEEEARALLSYVDKKGEESIETVSAYLSNKQSVIADVVEKNPPYHHQQQKQRKLKAVASLPTVLEPRKGSILTSDSLGELAKPSENMFTDEQRIRSAPLSQVETVVTTDEEAYYMDIDAFETVDFEEDAEADVFSVRNVSTANLKLTDGLFNIMEDNIYEHDNDFVSSNAGARLTEINITAPRTDSPSSMSLRSPNHFFGSSSLSRPSSTNRILSSPSEASRYTAPASSSSAIRPASSSGNTRPSSSAAGLRPGSSAHGTRNSTPGANRTVQAGEFDGGFGDSDASEWSRMFSNAPQSDRAVAYQESSIDFVEPTSLEYSPEYALSIHETEMSSEIDRPATSDAAQPMKQENRGKMQRTKTSSTNFKAAPKCSSVWFISSGDVYSRWIDFPGGDQLQANLDALYESKNFIEYVSTVERILAGLWFATSNKLDGYVKKGQTGAGSVATSNSIKLPGISTKRVSSASLQQKVFKQRKSRSANELDGSASVKTSEIASSQSIVKGTLEETHSAIDINAQWQRLVITANAFSIILIEKKKFGEALNLLNLTLGWASNDDILTRIETYRLRGIVLDVFAYFYYCRKKLAASLDYCKRSLQLHEKFGSTDSIAGTLLHIATILSQQGNFKESHKYIYQVLAMVEEGSLGLQQASSQQLCMVAVMYHNLAVTQLKMNVPDLACKSSQSARKIAKLCLSHSNRWISMFQRTHEIALDELQHLLSQRKDLTMPQKRKIKEMADTLFDPAPKE